METTLNHHFLSFQNSDMLEFDEKASMSIFMTIFPTKVHKTILAESNEAIDIYWPQ
jgi:hypothetical protein